MIPYALAGGKLHMDGGESIEIRMLEMAGDWFSFRLPCEMDYKMQHVVGITLHFLRKDKQYESLNLQKYVIAKSDRQQFFTMYRMDIADPEYRALADDLGRRYLQYIENKLTLTDAALAAYYTTYPAEDDDLFEEQNERIEPSASGVSKSQFLDGQLERWIAECENRLTEGNRLRIKELLSGISIGIEAGNTRMSGYLGALLDIEDGRGVEDIAEYIYVGNSFCINLLPQKEELLQGLQRACESGKHVVLQVAPVPESRYEEAAAYLKWLAESLESTHFDCFEINVNDLATYEMCRELFGNKCRVDKGILLHKRKKDVRTEYLEQNPKVQYDRIGNTLYLPAYQMNTATYCTLRAAVCEHDRGHISRVDHCERYCDCYGFEYPEHLRMQGRYNSLFGIDLRVLWDADYLEQLIAAGIERVVFNL